MAKEVGVGNICLHSFMRFYMTNSTIDTLIWQALEMYPIKVLPQFLTDTNSRVRMAAARAIQLKGGDIEFELASSMLNSKKHLDREIAAFILGQLGTPKLPYRKQSISLLDKALKADRISSVRSAAAVIRSIGINVIGVAVIATGRDN